MQQTYIWRQFNFISFQYITNYILTLKTDVPSSHIWSEGHFQGHHTLLPGADGLYRFPLINTVTGDQIKSSTCITHK